MFVQLRKRDKFGNLGRPDLFVPSLLRSNAQRDKRCVWETREGLWEVDWRGQRGDGFP